MRQPPRHGRGRRAPLTRGTAGFSLVEILVVITLIGLLMTFGFSAMQSARESGRVTKCQDNLRQVGQALMLYKDNRNKNKWPRESGIRFLLTLHKHNEVTGRASDIFLCPGTQDDNSLGPSGEPGSSYEDWENITSDTISYAGRDVANFPLRGDASSMALAADDNEYGKNHENVINVLYADGSVVPWDMYIDGSDILAAYPEYEDIGVPVGPESPVEPLQALRID